MSGDAEGRLDMITPQNLSKIAPCSLAVASAWSPALIDTFSRYSINTKKRVAGFLSQCSHESGGFTRVIENLNYSEKALLSVFSKYFNAASAKKYARKPESIANIVYANRMENGDTASGDGWRFRGRGPIQLTGKRNYRLLSEATGIDFVKNPDLLLIPQYGALAAGWYWNVNNLNKYCDSDRFDNLCDAVNIGRETRSYGDSNGFADRLAIYNRAMMELETT